MICWNDYGEVGEIHCLFFIKDIEKMNYAMKLLKVRHHNIEFLKINTRKFFFKNSFLFGYLKKVICSIVRRIIFF
jgi:hypothetical protein